MRKLNKLLATALALVVPLCGWAQTESEPNDNTANADDISLDAAMNGDIGGAPCLTGGSVDYFKLVLAADGRLNINTSADHSSTGNSTIRVDVYNINGSQLTWFVHATGPQGSPNSATTTVDCMSKGTYYVRLQGGNAGLCYTYALTLSLTPPLFADDLEPNNTTAQAAINPVLAPNAITEGHVNFSHYDDNADYYRIETPEDGTLNVTLTTEAATAGNMRINVRNSGGTQLNWDVYAVGTGGAPVTNTKSYACYATGVYYLEVISNGPCGASYQLSYTVTPPVFANDLEPNNTTAQATTNPVLAPGVITEGRVNFDHYGDNADYYRIVTAEDGVLNITLTSEAASAGDMRINVRNSGGTQLNWDEYPVGTGGTPATTTRSYACYGAGVYFLEVFSTGPCGASYQVSYTVSPPLFSNDLEPNNTLAQADANPLLASNSLTEGRVNFNHYGNNADYYRIVTPGDGILNVTLASEAISAGNMRINVLNSGGTQLNWNQYAVGIGGTSTTVTQSYACYAAGEYYLQVFSDGPCGASYQLSYSVTAPIFSNDLEPNGTTATAGQFNPDSTQAEGHLNFAHYGENIDHYKVVLASAGNITFDLQAEAVAAGTIRFDLLNSVGTQINWNTFAIGGGNVPATSTVSFGPLSAGTFYLRTYSVSGCGVSYRMNCNDADNDGTCNYFDLCPGGPEPGTPCDDGSACTVGDVITMACTCAGEAILCDDNDPCTTDSCDPQSGCVFTPAPDTDGDGTCDITDGCPNDPNKVAPGICGCGVSDADTDSDGTADCNDGCPNDANKVAPGICGCGVSDADSDSDGTADCNDGCPNDANKITPGTCGCGVADTDSDNDGTPDCNDACPNLANLVNGNPCDDGNANTINDVVANCICAGTLLGNDCEGVPGGPAQPGTACNDNDDCTTGDVYDANCLCAGTFADADNDGTCDADDLCPGGPEPGTACNDNDDCTTGDVIGANCLCAGTFADADADGTCDADDLCPGGPEPGTLCDDLNVNTINDVIGTNCLCAGTLLGNDCEGVPGGPAVPGTACDDNDDCTTGDVYDVNCVCAGTFADADNDGTCDLDDVCPGGPEPGSACNDNDPCTVNDVVNANCGCAGTFADADNDGTCDANDLCPGGPEPGTGCDDGDANTINDMVGANCLCAGFNPNCTEDLVLTINLDAFGSQTTWEVRDQVTNTVMADGGPYTDGASGTVLENLCLAVGCYQLSVFDANGDGISAGGYVLTDDLGRRMVDANGLFTSTSSISAGAEADFCLPVTGTFVKANWCDRTDLVPSSFIYCQGVAGATGYQFWFFDPHGSYSRRILKPTTACQMNWTTQPIPTGLDLNVRVRALVGGNYQPFGKACRITVQPQGGASFRDLTSFDTDGAHLSMYPNPNRDEVLYLMIEGLSEEAATAQVEIFDAMGKRIASEQLSVAAGTLNRAMTLSNDMEAGLYFVHVVVDGQTFTERLVRQ